MLVKEEEKRSIRIISSFTVLKLHTRVKERKIKKFD